MINNISNRITSKRNRYEYPSLSLSDKMNSYRTASSNKAYIQRVASTWRVWSAINEEYAQYYDTAKEVSAEDDYWALDSGWGIMAYYGIYLPTATSGTFSGSTSASSYTTQAGAYLELTTTGTWKGLKVSHYTDNRGGIWRATINGSNPVDFSVYNAGTGFQLTSVYSGISGVAGDVIRLTFQGADPLNAPSGGTARGWVCRDSVTVSNAGRFQKAFYLVGDQNPNCCHETMTVAHTKYVLASGPSHKEFAFSTRARSGTIATQNQWQPNHSAIATTNASKFLDLSTDRIFTIDEDTTNYLTAFTDAFTFAVGGDKVVLRQVYEGCNIDDEPLTLFNITNIYTWRYTGLKVYGKLQAVEDLYNTTGYISMQDAASSEQTHTICNGTEFDNTVNTSGGFTTLVTQAELPSWTGDTLTVNKTGDAFAKSRCVSMSIEDVPSAMKLSNAAYLQEVRIQGNGARGKIYPAVVNNIEIDQGEIFEWNTNFNIGIVPDAFDTLKSYVGL